MYTKGQEEGKKHAKLMLLLDSIVEVCSKFQSTACYVLEPPRIEGTTEDIVNTQDDNGRQGTCELLRTNEFVSRLGQLDPYDKLVVNCHGCNDTAVDPDAIYWQTFQHYLLTKLHIRDERGRAYDCHILVVRCNHCNTLETIYAHR